MDIRNYPFLSSEEFHEACHRLESRYRRATLGPLRRRWRLRVCTSLDAVWASAEPGQGTYLQITRPVQTELDTGGLALEMTKFSFKEPVQNPDNDYSNYDDAANVTSGSVTGMEQDMIDAEEADEEALLLESEGTSTDSGYVTYEIHLHPTYCTPCLWFRLHGLPAHEEALSIDTVFRYLVPDQYKGGLRQGVAGIGGISIDHHPLTGVPFFFVHPCLLGEAMAGFDCDIEHYLMVWIGLAGSCVGLWVPKEMATVNPPDA